MPYVRNEQGQVVEFRGPSWNTVLRAYKNGLEFKVIRNEPDVEKKVFNLYTEVNLVPQPNLHFVKRAIASVLISLLKKVGFSYEIVEEDELNFQGEIPDPESKDYEYRGGDSRWLYNEDPDDFDSKEAGD